jgi:uncharacterized Zn finger protein
MLESQLSTFSPRTAASRRCPQCEAPAIVQRATPGRSGFEHWTLRCTSCGNIHQAQVQTDPMKSATAGWLSGDLHAPT